MYDAIVIGGGPAGSTAAHLLARWGHRVVLVRRPARADRTGWDLAESLPPSCLRLLGQLGLLEAVDAARFTKTFGNTVWWGDAGRRSETFPDGVFGYQVVRSKLERVLVRAAESSGARLLSDRTVRDVTLGSPAIVTHEGIGGDRDRLEAPFVLDCSGRAGVIATRDLRKSDPRQRTVALIGVWRREGGWDLPDSSHTLVESYGDGWAWSVPVSETDRYVTLMVHPGVTAVERGARLAAAYDAELCKTRQLAALVPGAERLGPPRSCDASLYSAERYSGEGFLLVGDAGSFIEPLSSFGVKKALASAWVAAVVTHTCLTKPSMSDTALEFFDAREHRVLESYQRQSAKFFETAASAHQHPFWSDRYADPSDDGLGHEAGVDIEALRSDPEVLRALQALKSAAEVRLRPTERYRLAPRPAIVEREVVLEEQIVEPTLPGAPTGLRFLRGVDLPALIRIAGDHEQVPDLFEAYNRLNAPVNLPDFLGALSVLLAKGFLEDGPLG